MTGWSELRKLPRNLWILNFAILINRLGTMAFLFLGLYLTKKLGYPAKVAGMLIGSFGLGSLVATPLGGWLCDRLGTKQVLFCALAIPGLIYLVFPFLKTVPELFLATVFLALVSETFYPASLTLTTLSVSSDLRKPSIALNRLAINLGMSVGPLVGGFLAQHSFQAIFWVNAGTSLAAALVIGVFLRNVRPDSAEAAPSYWKNLALLSRDWTLVFFLLAMLPIGMVWFQFNSTFPIFLVKDLGFPEIRFGLLFTINTLMIVFLEVPINVLTARWPHRWVLAISSLLYAIGFGSFAYARTYLQVSLGVVVNTVGEMLSAPSAAAYVSEISPKGREGSYMGLYSASFSLCLLFGPLLGTWVYDACGPVFLWQASFFLSVFSGLLFTRISGWD